MASGRCSTSLASGDDLSFEAESLRRASMTTGMTVRLFAASRRGFVAIYDRAFLIGPGFCAGVANGMGVATIPEFIWELSFGIYLIVKGFKPSPLLAGADSEPVARGTGS